MNPSRSGLPRRQSGAVLIVSLIMLAVLTLFVISMIKTSVIELKIGGSSQTAMTNLAAAESAANNFLTLNAGRFAPNWITAAGTAGPDPLSLSYTAANNAYGALGTTVSVTPTQIFCGTGLEAGVQFPPEGVGNGISVLQWVFFDIYASATGSLGIGGTTVVHQGVRTQTLAC